MTRRSFLKGLSVAGLLPILDAAGLLGEEERQVAQSLDSPTPAESFGQPDQALPWPKTDDGFVMTRLKQELSIIRQIGGLEEFEAVRTVFSQARSESTPCSLTGAGCSSVVLFLLGASHVLPTRYGLYFERFRDPGGRWAPPFLIQVEPAGLDQLVDFTTSRYPKLAAEGRLCFSPMATEKAALWQTVQDVGSPISLDEIPWSDQDTFELLGSGDMEGVSFFQDPAIQEDVQRLQPKCLDDLVAIIALLQLSVDRGDLLRLYEEHGKESPGLPEAVHPVMTETTADSRGLILFQEQVMMLLDRLGRISPADGYDFIKAAATNKSAIVAEYRERFLKSAGKRGIANGAAEGVFEQLRGASSYACCKAGCVADAVLAYRGAYLKAHYPMEFSRMVPISRTKL